jgi:tetratricopeptide (TPR) repeat protein
MAALVMSAAGVMSCSGRNDANDKEPLNSGTAAPVTGGTTGVNAEPAARVTAEALAALDAGNAAYRAKDYPAALAGYEKAARLAPQHPAPWFGIYMVAQVRKDTKAADTALAEIRRRNETPSATHSNLDSAAATGERARTGVDPSSGA